MHKQTVADVEMKNEMAAGSHQKHSNSNNQFMESHLQIQDYEAAGDDSDHMENVMILQHLSGSKPAQGRFHTSGQQDICQSLPFKMNTDSDVSSPLAKNQDHNDSDHGDLDLSLEEMQLNEAAASIGHQ